MEFIVKKLRNPIIYTLTLNFYSTKDRKNMIITTIFLIVEIVFLKLILTLHLYI